jgi:CdiI N-terminal domain
VTDFSIKFIGYDRDDPQLASGELRFGEDVEYFRSPLGFWRHYDYEHNWKLALERLVDGASFSCLTTSVGDPATTNSVEVWTLYREGDDVHIQDALIFLDEGPGEFDPTSPWEFVDPVRSVVDEDGKIAEWHVTLDEIREFLESGSGSAPALAA